MKLDLPFPPGILNPNSRKHWRPHAKAKKKYRQDCHWLSINTKPEIQGGKIYLKITFHPPCKRKRDKDNMIAAFKAGQDGMADAWGVDDSLFNASYHVGDIVKHGSISIVIDQ